MLEILRATSKVTTGVVPAGRDALTAGYPPSGLGGGDGHPTNPLAGVTTPRSEEGRAHRRLRGCGNRTQPGGLQGNHPAVRRRGGEQTAVATTQGPRGASLAKLLAGVTTPRREAGRTHRDSQRDSEATHPNRLEGKPTAHGPSEASGGQAPPPGNWRQGGEPQGKSRQARQAPPGVHEAQGISSERARRWRRAPGGVRRPEISSSRGPEVATCIPGCPKVSPGGRRVAG